MLKKQSYFPRFSRLQDIPSIRNLGMPSSGDAGDQVYQDDTFLLQVSQLQYSTHKITQTRQEEYLKFNFWLEGRHTTVLNGFGQCEHERPKVLITAGPRDMVKMDLLAAGRSRWVALCVLREFFEKQMSLEPAALPAKLRAMVLPGEAPFTAHTLSLTPDLASAAHSVFAAPSEVRRIPLYAHSKALELMSLLMRHLADERGANTFGKPSARQVDRLNAARELLASRYAESWTLQQLGREVGLSKTALTVGFRQVFGRSVFDYLLKERMQRAYDLLQSGGGTIEQVARAVGYGHACNFSTAFRAHFGYSPRALFVH